MKMRNVKPAKPAVNVRRADNGEHLPHDKPSQVPDTGYYRRMIRAGDLVDIDKAAAEKSAAKAPAKKTTGDK